MADRARAGSPPLPKMIGGYRIVSLLGQGGIVEAYRAANADGTVALRVLRQDTKVPMAKEAHDREVEILQTPALARARHVARYVAHGTDDAHGPWIATEFVDGMTLQDLLSKGAIPENEALEIVMSICDALEELAMAGIVHRDLKPDNIMLVRVEAEQRWTTKLIDLNIAVYNNSLPNDGKGKIAGTPNYMSPEQCRGETMTTMSDMFSLGCILFRMLTGRIPMADPKGSVIKTLEIRAAVQEAPERPQDISESVWNALEGALHPYPWRRLNPSAFKFFLTMSRWGTVSKPEAPSPIVSGVVKAASAPAAPGASTMRLPQVAARPKLARTPIIAGVIMMLITIIVATNILRSPQPPLPQTVWSTANTDAGSVEDASRPERPAPPRRTHARRREAPPQPRVTASPPPRPRPRPRPAPTPPRVATHPHLRPIAGARALPNGNYQIPHPEDWGEPDVVANRDRMCRAFRARNVQPTPLFHRFCDGRGE